ncbi:hypothetical protein RchiOBHm_Chr5g0080881 [Rosa chinensis]|uniref:Uncharacterized protein n=1 Tax=Rosa chinensis TaxID=74649 RepID=A0A2P6QMV9_ROSCH|nr:hypothetical protein RchiOBHm_Chr5g0080881 [Rosa chinensis]
MDCVGGLHCICSAAHALCHRDKIFNSYSLGCFLFRLRVRIILLKVHLCFS